MNLETRPINPKPRHWLMSVLADRRGRVALLVFVVVLELAALSFVKSQTWNRTLLVVSLCCAGLPLMIAVLLLAQRRIKLSTMLIVFALICVFLSLVVIPIRRERNLRVAAQRFEKTGASARTNTYFTKSKLLLTVNQPSPDWLKNIAFVDSKLQDSEIQQVIFKSNEQVMNSLDILNRCKNLREVFVQVPISNSALTRLAEEVVALDIRSFGASASPLVKQVDLSAFDDSSLEHLSIAHPNALSSIAEIELPNIDSMFIGGICAIGNTDQWEHCLDSTNLTRVSTLSLHDCILGNLEAAKLGRLDNLVTLGIQTDKQLSDMAFVAGLKNLKNLNLVGVGINDKSLGQLESANQLATLYLGVPKKRFTDKALNSLQRALPDCEIQIIANGRRETLE